MTQRWVCAALAGFTFLAGYLRSFVLPDIPCLGWGDALGYATKGVRLLDGEWPYRDFFDFVTPGTELVYAFFFRWVGVSFWAPNLLMCLLAAATTFLITWCAQRLLLPGTFVLLPGLLVTGFTLYGSFDPTHHWFCTVLVMAVIAVLFEGFSAGRILVAGVLCGLAASFTQSTGAVIVLAVLVCLWFHSRENPVARGVYLRRSVQLCGAAFAVFTIINLPFVLAAGPERWFAHVVIFPLRYFGTVSPNNWQGTVEELTAKKSVLALLCPAFLYVAVPVAYLWTLVELWKKPVSERGKEWDRLLLLTSVGGAMVLAIVSGPSIRRISCASPPAMILLVWQMSRQGKPWHMVVRGLAAASVVVALEQGASVQLRHSERLLLPVGSVAILDAGNAEVYRWMASKTQPGQWYFGMPPYTLPLKLRNPTRIESPSPGEYCRPEEIAAAIAGLERTRTKMLLLRPSIYVPHYLSSHADHLQPFHDYVLQHYRREKTFGTGDEVWRRIEDGRTD